METPNNQGERRLVVGSNVAGSRRRAYRALWESERESAERASFWWSVLLVVPLTGVVAAMTLDSLVWATVGLVWMQLMVMRRIDVLERRLKMMEDYADRCCD